MGNGKKSWTPQQINAAINAGVSVYRTGKQINAALRGAQRSATPRMHPRDFKIGSRAPGKYPASLGPMSVRKRVRMTTKTKRGFGAINSRSAGFLKTRRKKRKPKGYQAGRGITCTLESGGPLSADEMLYVGHITGPKSEITKIAWQCILKLLLQKMTIRLLNLSRLVSSDGFVAGDLFRFSWTANPTTTAVTVRTMTLGGGEVYSDIVDNMIQTFWTADAADIMPQKFEYIPAAASKIYARSIGLQDLMLHYQIKSSLKIQNRTLNSAGNDESDDVDNVPIYGKSIGGTGTYCQSVFPNSITPANIIGEFESGIIRNIALDDNALEPLSSYFWPKSKQEGKIKLDPGELKTSVLNTNRNISLKVLYKMFSTPLSSTQPACSFGHFRFFQLEKMIDTSALPVIVGYEVNTNYNCYATTKYNWTTAPVFKKL